MEVHIERLPREIVVEHDLAADKSLERERGQHVQAETQPRHVDHRVVGGEIIEHIAQGLVAKGEKPREGHQQAGEHGDARGEVRYFAETVDGRSLEGAIDEEGIVMADEGCLVVVLVLSIAANGIKTKEVDETYQMI